MRTRIVFAHAYAGASLQIAGVLVRACIVLMTSRCMHTSLGLEGYRYTSYLPRRYLRELLMNRAARPQQHVDDETLWTAWPQS